MPVTTLYYVLIYILHLTSTLCKWDSKIQSYLTPNHSIIKTICREKDLKQLTNGAFFHICVNK